MMLMMELMANRAICNMVTRLIQKRDIRTVQIISATEGKNIDFDSDYLAPLTIIFSDTTTHYHKQESVSQ